MRHASTPFAKALEGSNYSGSAVDCESALIEPRFSVCESVGGAGARKRPESFQIRATERDDLVGGEAG